jgi:hypothetical protein
MATTHQPCPAGIPLETDGFEILSRFLIASPFVTRGLEAWRRKRGFGDALVWAEPIAAPRSDELITRAVRKMHVARDETVTQRAVRLVHGGMDLATALNVYVPDRLPQFIREALLSGVTPFGRLIEPAGGYRVHLDAKILVVPSPRLQHRAIVRLGTGVRVAYVEETFLPATLAWAKLA